MAADLCYAVFGLTVRSQIRLDGLVPGDSAQRPDVRIRQDRIEPGAAPLPGYNVLADGTLLNIPEIGRYLIRDGTEIVVDAEPGASERNVRLYLLGSALGALLHQRGIVPLHANAIEIGGKAVAFSGHSGAGKSTIAAWFQDRGYRLLSDDVCALAFGEDERVLAYPGIPRVRLWRDALEAGGRQAERYDRSFDGADKYDVPMDAEARSPGPAVLDRVYFLKKSDTGGGSGIVRLSGVNAVDALISNTYRGGYLPLLGETGRHMMQCLRLAKTVPVFEAARAWGFEAFEEQALRIEEHALRGDLEARLFD